VIPMVIIRKDNTTFPWVRPMEGWGLGEWVELDVIDDQIGRNLSQ